MVGSLFILKLISTSCCKLFLGWIHGKLEHKVLINCQLIINVFKSQRTPKPTRRTILAFKQISPTLSPCAKTRSSVRFLWCYQFIPTQFSNNWDTVPQFQSKCDFKCKYALGKQHWFILILPIDDIRFYSKNLA